MLAQLVLAALLVRPVTWSHAAAPVPEIVAALAKETGERLVADDRLSRDFIIVRFKSTALDLVLARIAKTLEAEWQDSPDGRKLVRTGTGDEAQREKERRMLRAKLDERARKGTPQSLTEKDARDVVNRLQAIRKKTEEDPESVNWRDELRLIRLTPSGRMESRITAALLTTPLEQIPIGKRVVYSLKPVGVQKPLPRACLDAAAMMASENVVFERAAKEAGQSATVTDDLGFGFDFSHIGKIDKWVVSVRREDDWFDIEQSLSGEGFSTSGGLHTQFEFAEEERPELPDIKGGYVPSDAVKAYTLAQSNSGTWDAPALSKESVENLTGGLSGGPWPDPLAAAPSEILIQAAESLGTDLVACLPDSCANLYWTLGDSAKLSLTEAFWQVVSGGPCEWSTADGWLQVKPQWPIVARYCRADRRALETWVKGLAKSGVTFENAGAALKTDNESHASALSEWALLPFLGEDRRFNTYQAAALRLFGNLGADAQAQARKGGVRFNLGSATPAFSRELSRLAFDEGALELMSGRAADSDAEATTLFPGGLPRGAGVTVQINSRKRILRTVIDPDGWGQYDDFSSDEGDSAGFGLIGEEIEFRTTAPEERNRIGYGEGQVEELCVTVDFGDGLNCKLQSEILPRISDTKFGGFDTLPESVRKQFDETWNRLPEDRKKIRPPRPARKIKPSEQAEGS